MKILNILFSSFLLISCTQKAQIFKIEFKTVKEDLDQELKQIKNWEKENILYTDINYEVSSTCDGEWGGKVFFKNKITKKTFVTPATCAISINKINDKYYISNSLAHLTGFTNVLEIINPEKLNLDNSEKDVSKKIIVAGSDELSTKGSKKIVDSTRVLLRTSFVYNDKIYSILTDNERKKNTISEIKNNKFQTIQELPDNIFKHQPIIIKNSDYHQKLYFQNPKSGILEITNNQIKITYYEK